MVLINVYIKGKWDVLVGEARDEDEDERWFSLVSLVWLVIFWESFNASFKQSSISILPLGTDIAKVYISKLLFFSSSPYLWSILSFIWFNSDFVIDST